MKKAGRARIDIKLKKHAAMRSQARTEEIIGALAAQTVTVTGTNVVAIVIPHLSSALDGLYRPRADVDEQIAPLVTHHPLYLVLTSMPGVGVRTSTVIITELAGKDLASAAHIASYAGLTP